MPKGNAKDISLPKNIKIKYVLKRNGRKERFSSEKLFKSIQKSMKDTDGYDSKMCRKITVEIIRHLEKKYKGKVIDTFRIREAATYYLTKKKLKGIARFYILHRYL